MVCCRRALVVLVVGCSFAALSAAGCSGRGSKLEQSRRLTAEGTALRDEGWKTGDREQLEEGQEMIDKGTRLREEALEGM
jgi:hypothetical protein